MNGELSPSELQTMIFESVGEISVVIQALENAWNSGSSRELSFVEKDGLRSILDRNVEILTKAANDLV